MGSKVNKQNPKNWEENDVFAIKINSKDKEYDGKYFILIKGAHPNWSKEWKYPVFRVKITNDGKLPKTQEEIEELKYIRTGFYHFIERYCLVCSGLKTYNTIVKEHENVKYFPDKNGLLYFYHFTIFVKYRKNQDIIYLGNFNISLPNDESYIEDQFVRVLSCRYDHICEDIIANREIMRKYTENINDENLMKIIKNANQHVEITKSTLDEVNRMLR